jgi:hypothetical protein
MPALTHASTTETTRGITIYGVDFTSAPSRRKPLTCIHYDLSSTLLTSTTALPSLRSRSLRRTPEL